jgi:myo-inositol 2-dehydrogenase / D-chiro-inositol 1-dehydrogenase
VKKAGRYEGRVPEDWRERFIRAYDTEFQEWIDAARKGESTGPSSWDGYAATVVCAAGLDALNSGERVEIDMGEQPDLYKATAPGPSGTD